MNNTLASVRDCDRELDRISQAQKEAIKAKVFWKLAYLRRQKKSVSDQRDELQHRDLFKASPFDRMREATQ